MNKKILLVSFIVISLLIALFAYNYKKSDSPQTNAQSKLSLNRKFSSFDTNIDKYSLDPAKLISGGPGKDKIPAVSNPAFTTISDAIVSDETMGILVNVRGTKKYYPFNILVWHEIVNDSIDDTHFAVTFCPLCGSAIVFDRTIEGVLYEFGVSGFLYDSNMIMFDRSTQTLWQQSTGKAVIGDLLGSQLNLINMQRIKFEQVKANHPQAMVMSRETGYNRNYDIYPYGDYDTNDQIIFPISISDSTYDAKEIMYVVPVSTSFVAIKISDITDGSTYTKTINDTKLTLRQENSEIVITDENGGSIPGYYEMWFSWAAQHPKDGEVWKVKD